MPLFEDLDIAELQSVADAMYERTFSVGEQILAEGAAPKAFAVVAP